MKILKETESKGKKRVTVELEAGERLISIKNGRHYKLGYPVEDIVPDYVVAETREVSWCSVSQKWVDAT